MAAASLHIVGRRWPAHDVAAIDSTIKALLQC